jgi:hypothetical protein
VGFEVLRDEDIEVVLWVGLAISRRAQIVEDDNGEIEVVQ